MVKPIPDKLVVLTFDDGVKSQATFAAPLLKQYGFNATFYITEGLNFLDKKTRYMTWEEVKTLHDEGFEIGNHTRHHKNVTTQSREELQADLIHIDHRCKSYGIPIPETFCYPGYSNNLEAAAALADHGFRFARRGTAPEYPYNKEGGRGPAYDPQTHSPLLIPTTGTSGPHWDFDDFLWALDQAKDGNIAVLTFHGVPDLDHPWVHTDPEVFTSYMDHLHKNDYTVIALKDLDSYIDSTPS
ncbi:MAG: polysaccharide deacetylase family protein [bacterium]|nr:polysaccharide deacetylase family protein [bacterium]